MAYNNEADRRSNVSSFYGGRSKSPFLPLNAVADQSYQSPTRQPLQDNRTSRIARDDASSFYAGNNYVDRPSSAELLNNSYNSNAGSAGYNRMSFFKAGREAPVKGGDDEERDSSNQRLGSGQQPPEESWDVYADFNNAGPRYSTGFGSFRQEPKYQPLPPDRPFSTREGSVTSSKTGPVELVTVPALGAEWRKEELQSMTKAGRKQLQDDDRSRHFKAWIRDQRGLCGKWGTRKQVVIVLFVLCCIVAIVVAITLPRVPAFTFFGANPLVNSTTLPLNAEFNRSPVNFTFNAAIALEVETSSSIIPINIKTLSGQVFDGQTGKQVGEGNMTIGSVPAKQITQITLPISFSYGPVSNSSDITWNNWHNACENIEVAFNFTRPALSFQLIVSMDIVGLVGSKSQTLQITDVNCPFQLAENAG